MFHFESLELLYWDYWERVRIPFDERIIVIVGPNGSGKTTLLDAMRTLLGIKTSAKKGIINGMPEGRTNRIHGSWPL